jgi:drug/metabolite transporter (DMT)-like permease
MHTAILLWGFTGILGKAIQMSEGMIVWYRMLISAFSLGLYMMWKKQNFITDRKSLFFFASTGMVVALHWLTFYGAIKASNVSVTLACFSSIAFFTALLEPLVLRSRHHFSEIILGLGVVAGIYLIFSFQKLYATGILMALLSALLGSLFTIANRKLMQHYPAVTVTFYELSTGFLFLTLCLPVYFYYTDSSFSIPGTMDFLWLLLLGVLCTTVAFTISLEALKKVSAFTMNLSVNLEPLYSILLALLIFQEGRELKAGFYAGTVLIIGTVVLHTYLVFRHRRKK